MDQALLNRPLNEGFSGGEKKRNEILQMAVLDPTLAIARRNRFGTRYRRVAGSRRRRQRAAQPEDRAMIVITHYQRLLDYIVPDFIHVLYDGRIVKSGAKELALELEAQRLRLDQERSRRGVNNSQGLSQTHAH